MEAKSKQAFPWLPSAVNSLRHLTCKWRLVTVTLMTNSPTISIAQDLGQSLQASKWYKNAKINLKLDHKFIKSVRENILMIMSKENNMHIFRPWKKEHLKSFKKIELKVSIHERTQRGGGQGVQTHPLKNHKLFGFLYAIIGTSLPHPNPWKMLDSSGALENYSFLWKEQWNVEPIGLL